MDSGGIWTTLKGGLGRLRRMASSPFPPIGRLFGASWWGGLGTICIIALSASIFVFGQRLQDYRLQEQVDQTIAHLVASAEVGPDIRLSANGTDYWAAAIIVSNTGPETAHRVRIRLLMGSEGVRPVGRPDVGTSEGNDTVTIEQYEQDQNAPRHARCSILVDTLHPDEAVTLWESFAVDETRSDQLLSLARQQPSDPAEAYLVGEPIGKYWDLSVKDNQTDPEYEMLDLLVPEITSSGQRISYAY